MSQNSSHQQGAVVVMLTMSQSSFLFSRIPQTVGCLTHSAFSIHVSWGRTVATGQREPLDQQKINCICWKSEIKCYFFLSLKLPLFHLMHSSPSRFLSFSGLVSNLKSWWFLFSRILPDYFSNIFSCTYIEALIQRCGFLFVLSN